MHQVSRKKEGRVRRGKEEGEKVEWGEEEEREKGEKNRRIGGGCSRESRIEEQGEKGKERGREKNVASAEGGKEMR